MALQAVCPLCKAEFPLDEQMLGQSFRCERCTMLFTVSAAGATGPGAAVPAAAPPVSAAPAIQAPVSLAAPEPLATPGVDEPPAVPGSDTGVVPRPFAASSAPSAWETDRPAAAPRPRMPQRPARGTAGRTPVFVWLIPVIFGVLFLLLAGVGVAIISAQSDWHANAWKKPIGPVPPVANKWDKDIVVEERVVAAQAPIWSNLNNPDLGQVAVQDRLGPGDAIDVGRDDRPNCWCKVYNVPLTANRRYVIEMTRLEPFDKSFETYLRLEENQRELAVGDSDGLPTARLEFTAAVTTNYRVVATTFSQASGNFRLTIRLADDKGAPVKGPELKK